MTIYDDTNGYHVSRVIHQLSSTNPTIDQTTVQEKMEQCIEEAKTATKECEKSFVTFKCFMKEFGAELKQAFVASENATGVETTTDKQDTSSESSDEETNKTETE